jgi:pyruvate dehydrogenase E2 component (dihydrolipoamide acetyltransferase)
MARLVDVRVPDMGNFSDVAIIDVLVKPGDAIDKDTALITLETEKATMDVPSDVGGVIEKLHVTKGGKISPGDVVATVRVEGEGSGSAPAGASAEGSSSGGPAASTAQNAAGSAGAGSGAGGASGAGASGAGAAGAGTSGGSGGSAKPATSGSASSAASAAPSSASAATSAAKTTAPSGANGASASNGTVAPAASAIPGGRTDLAPINEAGFSKAHAGPSVRRFARELGVDLSQLGGTGFKSRITHDDVKAYVKKALTGGGAGGKAGGAGSGVGLPQIPPVDFAKFGPIETKPLSRIQKISGPRLHASWVNIPHVTQFDEADITDLEDVRNKLKQKALTEGIKLTPLAFIVRACVKALQEFPVVNSSLDATGANLVMKKYVNIGFAADTPNGLMVPVIANADRMDVYRIARALGELSEKARAGKLSAAEMSGGCFTISSLGGIGGTAFTPIINAPEVAILGVSKSSMKPVYKDGTFIPRLTLPLSLSYDHRVIDGAMAVRFTTYLAGLLADPRQLTEAVL